jgi:signal transduction histidine kinase
LVYWKIGDYPKSIEKLFNSLEIKEQIGDQFEIALTLNNLSNVYNEMGNYSTAIVFSKRALEISEGSGNNYALGRALGNIGVSYSKMKNFKEALSYLKQALSIKKMSGEVKGLGYTHLDIGNIYSKLDSSDLAIYHYLESLKIMTDIDDSHGLALSNIKLSEIYLSQNNYKLARRSVQNSMKHAKRANLRESIKNNYLILSRIYEADGDSFNSLKYFKLYSNLKDSLLSASTSSKIADLQIRYETAEKNKENELLKQKNLIQSYELAKQDEYILYLALGIFAAILLLSAIIYRYYLINKTSKLLAEKNVEIEKQKLRLEQLNQTKDKLFSIIAHDLKNPFQNIMGYTNLLSTDYDDFDDKEKQTIIKEIGNSSEASFQLLENLLQWAQSQTGSLLYAPTRVNYLEALKETLKPIKGIAYSKGIEIIIEKHDHQIFIDQDFLKTIIRNLVTNAIKFTDTEGKIVISSERNLSDLIITVQDNGIGMNDNKINKLFSEETYESHSGTRDERGTGLGLIICKELVNKYDGKIWVESEEGKGTKFFFTVPLAANSETSVI